MPKDNKKRGRREERKKRKHEHRHVEDESQSKRTRLDDQNDYVALGGEPAENFGGEQPDQARPDEDMVFYGMLDEEEQEYFKRADELLELNQFEDPESRSLFLANVYREADGKELKLANSQSCSRLMERLIQLSDTKQLKNLFQKFSGHFLNLIQHRFASHCCEALFIQSAPVVTEELIHPPEDQYIDPQDVQVSMENLFLYAINELEGNLGYLMTDRFASHALRVLLVVLAGEPLARSSHRSLLHSRKKEKVTISHAEKPTENILESRSVPGSFIQAMEKMIKSSVAGLDTTYLRALATHQTGNPALQLLVRLELGQFGKQRAKDEASIIRTLLPDDPITEGTDSYKFINGLIYDPIGSRLVECIVEFAPGKMFKALYKALFRERIGSLARNEVAGYVVMKVLERLSKEDLEEAMQLILPQIPNMVDRNRTVVIKTLIERCSARSVDTTPIAAKLETAFSGPNGFDITRLLRLGEAQFYGHIGEMALDPSASHVIDAIWQGTHGLAFIRERIAEELAENEAALRESFVGRKVWRNWKMDLYKRHRSEWVSQSRNNAGDGAFVPFPDTAADKKKGKTARTGIEAARARKLAAKQGKNKDREADHRNGKERASHRAAGRA
ncbi:putative rrna processing protein [Neofusicoccum parvum UCRNP2]|uniref:Nucleolar protein 9 n=1 Tax=Botryosphaeria parva (strain UCR-NP2) TaxID=1287680 RepID=R1EWW9_BOTPV|nr:putative rrna processing protein [Neofusicoccum parvum UCRNP2]